MLPPSDDDSQMIEYIQIEFEIELEEDPEEEPEYNNDENEEEVEEDPGMKTLGMITQLLVDFLSCTFHSLRAKL